VTNEHSGSLENCRASAKKIFRPQQQECPDFEHHEVWGSRFIVVSASLGQPPLIVVSPGGDAIPVPNGASGPVPVVNPQGNTTGFGYTGGSGGNGLDSKTTGVRVMDPTPARGASPGYPNGYVSYGNSSGQTVNGQTGQTVPRSDPSAHVPLSPPKPCPSGGGSCP
jgi:hypothetical protein